MKLKNKVAIITGGGSGIGHAIAIRFAGEGACVVVADINDDSAKSVVSQIQSSGSKAISVKTDVSNNNEAENMTRVALDEFGSVDILVNCAGGPGLNSRSFNRSTEEEWDHIVNLNLKGVRNCTKAIIDHMMDRRSGRLVNISSTAGMMGEPEAVAYSAAKAGIIGFTMALAKEVAGYGITVNAVSLGPIMTPSMQMEPERIKRSQSITGLGRIGRPEEVAALVMFLSSEESSFITGQNYPICGLKNLGLYA